MVAGRSHNVDTAFLAELLQHFRIAAGRHRLGIGKTVSAGKAVGLQLGQTFFIVIDPQGGVFVRQGV